MTIDRSATLAELVATIPPNIRRIESVEPSLTERGRELAQRCVDAELCLLLEIQRSRLEVST